MTNALRRSVWPSRFFTFFADDHNVSGIRRINPSGPVTGIAGNFTCEQRDNPSTVAAGAPGNASYHRANQATLPFGLEDLVVRPDDYLTRMI